MSGATTLPSSVAGPPAAARAGHAAGGRRQKPLKIAAFHAILIFASVVAAFPIIRVLGVALRPNDRLLDPNFSLIPPDATLDAFVHVLTETDFTRWIFNSLLVASGTALLGLIIAATSAYAFSRFRFRGRGVGLTFLLTTQLLPAAMLLVPLYIIAVTIGRETPIELMGTYTGLVFGYSVTTVPFSVWILKGYYDTVPIELEEAARIDGCSQLEAFWRVVLPLSTPALAIVFLFNFLTAWSEYFLARVLVSQANDLWTWPLGLQTFQQEFTTQWADLCAASILVSVPIVALFLYSSRWLISGVTLGAVKG